MTFRDSGRLSDGHGPGVVMASAPVPGLEVEPHLGHELLHRPAPMGPRHVRVEVLPHPFHPVVLRTIGGGGNGAATADRPPSPAPTAPAASPESRSCPGVRVSSGPFGR